MFADTVQEILRCYLREHDPERLSMSSSDYPPQSRWVGGAENPLPDIVDSLFADYSLNEITLTMRRRYGGGGPEFAGVYNHGASLRNLTPAAPPPPSDRRGRALMTRLESSFRSLVDAIQVWEILAGCFFRPAVVSLPRPGQLHKNSIHE